MDTLRRENRTLATPRTTTVMTFEKIDRLDAVVTRLGIVLSPDGDAREAEGVLNPAGVRARTGEFLLYPRCVAAGNVSRIGLVRVHANGNDRTFERCGYALEPEAPYEHRSAPGGEGCEDARVTFVPVLDRYVMAYTAFGPSGPRIALALSPDGYSWTRLGLADFSAPGLPAGDDKDAAFFPEPVVSPAGVLSLALYHRPMLHISAVDGRAAVPVILDMPPADRESICIAYIPLEPVLNDVHNLLKIAESVQVLVPHGTWGRIKLGGGTVPVRIAEGWFSLYHGVDAIPYEGGFKMRYSAGIVIHDAEDLTQIRYRSDAPVMVPEGDDELVGMVGNVVFPTAIDVDGDRTFDVYYGMADSRIGRARIALPPAVGVSEEAAA